MIFATLGWAGTVLYLGNHGYLSFHRNHQPQVYFVLNFVAAIALITSSTVISSWHAVATNAFWGVVSFFAFTKIPIPIRVTLSERWLIYPIFVAGGMGIVYSAADFSMGMTILGWAAGALFCAAYILFTTAVILRVQFLLHNIIAALTIMPVLFLQGNWPVFGLEIAWVCVSLYGWSHARKAG